MAHNDQNDEYKFDEFDSLDSDSPEHEFGSSESPSSGMDPKPPKKDVKRNAMIAVGVVVAAMLGYKLIGGKSSAPAKGSIPAAPVASQAPQAQPQLQPQPMQAAMAPQPIQQPIQPIAQPVAHENNTALTQKVDSIEVNQQNVQSQVSSMNEQVGNVNNNVNNLSAEINRLNQTIANLTTQLSRQSEEITLLMERTRPRRIHPIRPPRQYNQANIYYINAVIPGRAWLIGTNGSTLTVREGTKIAGYGVVKLVDSVEGRILTSSGRVIRFSQEDS